MASKVNTKFIVIIVAAVAFAGAILGGLWVLQWRGDATRNIRQGDAALAEGDVKSARDYYGRAVHKQPGNMAYLDKFEQVVRSIKPQTTEEAVQLYRELIGIMQRRAKHRSTDPEAHLALLRELHTAARQTTAQQWWEAMVSAADDMLDGVPEDDPKRVHARVYRCLGTLELSSVKELSDLSAACDELREVIKEAPNDDLAWATLVQGQRIIADKMRVSGKQPSAITDQWKVIDQVAEEAAQAAPQGPETARLVLWRRIVRHNGDPEMVSTQQVTEAADHLLSLLDTDSDSALITESADLLSVVREPPPLGYLPKAIDLLKRTAEKHPDALDKRLGIASLEYMSNNLDEAARHATEVVNSEVMPASFMGQVQFELRRRAAGHLFDVEQRRWDQAPAEEKPQRMKSVEAARDKLASLVNNPASDLQVLRADGKIAHSKGEFQKSVNCFERVIKESGGQDVEVLLYSADGLEKIGEIGLAYDRIKTALGLQSRNWGLVMQKARLELRMGRLQDAQATINGLPAEEQAKPEVKSLAKAIETTLSGAPVSSEDPATNAINQAVAAMDKNDVAAARTALETALEKEQENLALLQTLVQVEFRDGQIDKAKEYLARAMKIQPGNLLYKQWDASFKYEDPIEALRHYQEAEIADEAMRAVIMVISLNGMAQQREAVAKRLEPEQPEEAKKARDLAARAREAMRDYLAVARQKAPSNPQLIEYEFSAAVRDANWPAAEEAVSRARAANSDLADGNLYKGRLELARGNAQEAAHVLEGVTDRLSYSSYAWRTLGEAYRTMGNWDQAQRAYAQAYNCNPNDLDAAWSYVTMLMRRGDRTRALMVLKSVRQLAPRNTMIREAWLQLEAEAGNRALAFAERKKLYKSDPDDRENAQAYARLLSETIPGPDFITDENLKPVYSQQRWDRFTADERQELVKVRRAEWQKQADDIINKLSEGGQADLRLTVLKARLYRNRNDVAAGETVIHDYIEARKDKLDAEMLIELGRYQADSNHFAEAIENFKQAMNFQDPKAREADEALGRLYLRLNMFDKAVTQLMIVNEASPNPALQQQIIECYIRLRNFDEAEKRLKALIAEHGSDSISTMLSATILEGRANDLLARGDVAGAERKYAEQREALARAESQDVTSPTPRVLLAQSYFAEYGRTLKASLLDDALLALERAEIIAPGEMQTSMVRVDVLKVKGDFDRAKAELRRVLQKQPDNPAPRRQLVQLCLETEDNNAAFEAIQDAITANPTLGFWHEMLGDLYHHVRNDPANAYKSYTRAYELVPTPAMLGKLLDCALAINPPNYSAVIQRLEAHQEEMSSVPTLRLLYARSLMGANKREEGLEQLRTAYAQYRELISKGAKEPEEINEWYSYVRYFFDVTREMAQFAEFLRPLSTEPDTYELRILARLWASTGPSGMSRAVELQTQALQKCPPEKTPLLAQIYLDLGNYQLYSKQFEAAVRSYEESIKLAPDNIEALNNLAFVVADDLNDPPRAVPYADRALALAPSNPSVLDTAGWVNFRAGNDDKAREYLRESLKLDDHSSQTHLHYAHVLLKAGDVAGAGEHLKRALELKPDPDTKNRIERLVQEINSRK